MIPSSGAAGFHVRDEQRRDERLDHDQPEQRHRQVDGHAGGRAGVARRWRRRSARPARRTAQRPPHRRRLEHVRPGAHLPSGPAARDWQVVRHRRQLDRTTARQCSSTRSWNTDAQKFFILASGSNWKIAMKANTNKCVGPVDNGTGNGTRSRCRTATAATTRRSSRRRTRRGCTRSRTSPRTAASTSAAAARRTAPAMQLYDCTGSEQPEVRRASAVTASYELVRPSELQTAGSPRASRPFLFSRTCRW